MKEWKEKKKNILEERLVGTLGGDHTVWDGGVGCFGTVIFEVRIRFTLDVRDPGHGWLVGDSLVSTYPGTKWSI